MRIALMTGGGDAPGLNGIIEAASRVLLSAGHEVIGLVDGFEGVFNQRTIALTLDKVEGAHANAGILLGSSNKSGLEGREAEFSAKFKQLNLDGLIACGGDGTFSGLYKVHQGLKLIGVPKDHRQRPGRHRATFGYDTACACVAENVDALRFTAAAHRRIFVIETMGRTAGWIALGGGMASYADAILLPERPFERDELLSTCVRKKPAVAVNS